MKHHRLSQFLPLATLSLALTAGCGGGGGGNAGAPASSPQKTPIGNGLVAEAFTTGSPITVAGSGSSVIGLTGTFSNIVWNNQNPKNEHSLIAFTEWNNLNVMDWNGTNLRTIYQRPESTIGSVCWYGDSIYFVETNVLRRIQVQGGNPTTILSNVTGVALSPIGPPRLALIRSGDLYLANPDGSGITLLSDLPDPITRVRWQQTAWIDVQTSTGWRSVRLSDGILASADNLSLVAMTRDVLSIRWLQSYNATEGYRIESRRRLNNTDYIGGALLDFNTQMMQIGANSPDDRFFLTLERTEGANTWGAERIVRRSSNGTSGATTVYNGGSASGNIGSIDVQPYVRTRLLTGPGSPFAWTAHALMWANAGTNPSGLALVRANNGNSIRISAGEPTQTGANIFYTVECDALTKVAFTVDRSYTLRDLPLTTGNNGVIFSFNSANGEVQSAFTYTVTRSEAKPTIERIGGRARISGSITGGFDRHGNPILPSGASLIEVDEKGTPKVIR